MHPTQPAKIFWLTLLVVFWAFYGLTGRDAWKAEEALAFAPVLDVIQGDASSWSTPAPLHVSISLLSARAGAAWFGWQEGARLASGLFSLIALAFTALAARKLFGPGYGIAAVLSLLGCLGLMLRMHALAPDTLLLATWAMLLAAVAVSREHPRSGGGLMALSLFALGLGLRGLPDLGIALALVLLPLASRDWRQPEYYRALSVGLAGFALAAYALLVHLHGSDQLAAWWHLHGFVSYQGPRALGEFFWFAWPAWPLALVAIWHEHRRLRRARELHFPLLALALSFLSSLLPAWSRDGSLLFLLPPLALLAAYAVPRLRRGAAQGFYWFGVVCFLFFLFAFWLYFAAIEWGMPVKLAAHVARLAPAYQPGAIDSLTIPVLATVLWLVAIPLFPRATIRPVLVWASGMVLSWTLLVSMFFPWVETSWAYRPVIQDLRQHLPAGACLKMETDAAMRTMVRYHLNPPQTAHCAWLLTDTPRDEAALWEGSRTRKKDHMYRLYRISP